MGTYTDGYRDAKNLIADLGDIGMARLAVPPAMSQDYQSGFLAACDDAVRQQRPNKNYILQVMRDGDSDDPWGTAMAWGFACAENLYVIGAEVPPEVEYQPSPVVDMTTWQPESYEDNVVCEYLDLLNVDVWTGDDERKIKDVQTALRCLHRYIDWCKAAGRDY